MLGPGVGSAGRGCVDPGCRVEAGRGAVLTVGGAGEHTASTLALPGTATELQLRATQARRARVAGLTQGSRGLPAVSVPPTLWPAPVLRPPTLACRARPLDPCRLRWDPRTRSAGQSHPGGGQGCPTPQPEPADGGFQVPGHGRPGAALPAPPEPDHRATHIRWGRQVSVDDVVLENVPGAHGAHTTSDVAVPSGKTWNPSLTQWNKRAWPGSPRRRVRGLGISVCTSAP